MYEDVKTPDNLLTFMDNINYGWISRKDSCIKNEYNDWKKEYFLQSPIQLLASKYGTCWDQVELERDWFSKHNYTFKTYFILFEVDYENKFPTHTFLVYEKDNKYYWFEHSWTIYSGIHEYKSLNLLLEAVKQKQLEYAINNSLGTKEDDKLLKIYEYDTPKYGCSVEEYLKFVTKKKALF